DVQEQVLPTFLAHFNQQNSQSPEPVPWLAALACCSAFDLATHDAFGELHLRLDYETYYAAFMYPALGGVRNPAADSGTTFRSALLGSAPLLSATMSNC